MPQARSETARRWTVREVRAAFPESNAHVELLDGELIVSPSPTPRHGWVCDRLRALVRSYLVSLGRELTLAGTPADISWDDETLVQPDLVVGTPEELSNDWRSWRTVVLAVEVLSPSSLRDDRVRKRLLYEEHGVATYWIVDHEAELVEVWRLGEDRPQVVTDTLVWRVTPESPELSIDLPALFAGLPR